MKKILFVIDERKLGGVSILLENILNNLDKLKYDIDILVLHNNGNRLENLDKNINIIYGPKEFNVIDQDLKSLLRKLKLGLAIKKMCMSYRLKTGKIANFIKRQRNNMGIETYDIEIAFKAGFCSAFVAYGDSKTKINWIHEDYATYNRTKRYEDTFKKIFNLFDKHITVCTDAKKSFCKIYGNEDKTFIIENYIDTKVILEKANSEIKATDIAIDKSKLNFVTLGRFCPEKGFERIIKALYTLKQELDIANVHAYIIGYGEYKERLLNEIIRLNLQYNIDIIESDKIANNPYAFMKECDMFVLSSLSESFGMVRVEALTLGLPVITTDVAYTKELIQDKFGIVVENSERGIYEGIKQAITNSEFVEKLKKQVKDYSYENKNKEILEKIQKMLEE